MNIVPPCCSNSFSYRLHDSCLREHIPHLSAHLSNSRSGVLRAFYPHRLRSRPASAHSSSWKAHYELPSLAALHQRVGRAACCRRQHSAPPRVLPWSNRWILDRLGTNACTTSEVMLHYSVSRPDLEPTTRQKIIRPVWHKTLSLPEVFGHTFRNQVGAQFCSATLFTESHGIYYRQETQLVDFY